MWTLISCLCLAGIASGDDVHSKPQRLVPAPCVRPWFAGVDPACETPAPSFDLRPAWVGSPNRESKIATLALLAGAGSVLATGDRDLIEGVGDVTQIFTPSAALGLTLLNGDRRGRRDLLQSFGASTLVVQLLKETLDKTRPNAQGVNSFPSGHTAAAFSGASFINWRYGTRWGIPAFVLAGYTGASRIVSEKHFLDDVLSGMSISLLSTRWFVEPVDGDREPQGFRYEWEFGGAAVNVNDLRDAPSGDTISFLFDEENNPTVTARVELGYSPANRHEVSIQIAPFEVRDFGRFAADVAVAGQSVPAGVELRTEYQLYDYRARYRYRVLSRNRWALDAGAGLSFQDIAATLTWNTGSADVEEGNFLPFAHVCAWLDLARKLKLFVEIEGGASGRDRLLDSALMLRYEVRPRWEIGGGLRRIDRRVVTDLLRNDQVRDQGVVALAYTF